MAQTSKSDKPTNVRVKFTYYFVFDPLYWITLLLKSSEPKTIRVLLGSQLVRQIQVDTSVTYACYGQSSTSAGQAYFYRGRERFVVRGFSGNATQLRFEVDFGSLNISAFGIDEVSMEVESSFKTSLGLSMTNPAMSCMHLKNERLSNGDQNPDGQYYIQLDPTVNSVYLPCSDGWIVAQRRINGKTNFNRNWNEYRDGFGLGSFSEWWIGNIMLAAITTRATEAMFVISKDYQSQAATYSDFRVASENEKYLLTVRGYIPTPSSATDALSSLSNTYFSTPDQDNDLSATQNCAKKSRSGFWYADCLSSTRSDLNAPFDPLPICTSYAAWAQSWCQKTGSIVWDNVDGYDSSTLLLRPDRCAPGSVSSNTGECSQCREGTYSEPHSQVCHACPAGTYGPSVGASSASACLPCPSGFKCAASSTAPVKCLAGTFADPGSSDCLNVPEGYAGPYDQMSRSDLTRCTNGTFSKPGQQNCSAVPPGFYCAFSVAACGYTSLAACPSRAVYCPEGNSGPIIVPSGYYSVGSKVNEQQSAILPCARGYYCRRGTMYLCPPTRFGDQVGLVNPLCSGRCAIGCVCKAGSVSRCPDAPHGYDQIALFPSSISYALAPLLKQPGETNDSLIQGVFSAMYSSAAMSLDVFEFRDINLTFFKTGWNSGFAHNISISYFEQSQVDMKYEFQVPIAGFDWGAIVLLDGNVVTPRSRNGTLVFSFVSSWGRHLLSVIAAESQFVVKRSILFRKTSDMSFSILRCDRLDGQPILLNLDISLCAIMTPTCKGSVMINGDVVRNLAQTTNSLEILIYSGIGAQKFSNIADASSTLSYLPTLSAMNTGDIVVVIGTTLGTFPSTLRAWLVGYGVSPVVIDSASCGFVFVGVNDNTTPATIDVVTSGSSYNLQLTLPLSQAISYYSVISVPAGYYALPENISNGQRCSGGVRTLAYVFQDSICVNKKHVLNINENDAGLVTTPPGLTYQLEASITSIFNLDNQNHVMLLKPLDYETQNTYDLTLSIQETQISVPYPACQIRVNVVDVNEAPVVVNYQASRTIKENVLPPVSMAPVIGVNDPDAYDSFTLSIASGGNGNFVINREGFIVATKSLDFEKTPKFVLDIVARDLSGLEGHASVVITVQDVPEQPTCTSFSFSVPENTTLGTTIGSMGNYASDQDIGDYITYELLSQSVIGTLTITPTTGIVTLKEALDFEIHDAILFKVRFTDKTSLQVTCDFNIAVTDCNDPPVLTGTVFHVPENCIGNDCMVGNLAVF
ncbi:Protocadherin-like protein, partial [Phytophthora palmivora]